jgi:hypothetical protein
MTRHFFVIGAPLSYEQPTFFNGVKSDIINFYNYARSFTGGAYRTNEVTVFENPTLRDLEIAFRRTVADYIVVVFSGHGYIQKETVQATFNINSYQVLTLERLILQLRAPKKLIIADSCRNYVESSKHYNFIGDAGVSYMKFPSYLLERRARTLYDQGIGMTQSGIQILFSASPGQSSTLAEDGSYYSKSLLQSVKNWSLEINQGSILLGKGAHIYASSYMQQYYSTKQQPQYKWSQGIANYPFAVRLGSEMLA